MLWLAATLALGLLTGCETVTLTDLTPSSLNENPSRIYTFTLRVTPRTSTVSAIAPHIIVDGQAHDMKPSPLGKGIYEFEFALPPNRDRIAYYYLVNYNVEGNNITTPMETYTGITHAQIVNRQVLTLVYNRGPVGAKIPVVGRGFTQQDTIQFDGAPVRTEFQSANSLSFYVPALEGNRNYQVTVTSPAGNSPVGTFRIDATSVTITPTALTMRTGEKQNLTFQIPNPAPAGGTLLDITTDVPESVIMPEVIVPAGQTSVSIPVEGGKPGNGNLFLKGFGSGEVKVPITVSGR